MIAPRVGSVIGAAFKGSARDGRPEGASISGQNDGKRKLRSAQYYPSIPLMSHLKSVKVPAICLGNAQ